MKKHQKNLIKLFFAGFIFLISVFSYTAASSMNDLECYVCNDPNTCSTLTEAGQSGCGFTPEEGCTLFGEICGCPDPTVPCEA